MSLHPGHLVPESRECLLRDSRQQGRPGIRGSQDTWYCEGSVEDAREEDLRLEWREGPACTHMHTRALRACIQACKHIHEHICTEIHNHALKHLPYIVHRFTNVQSCTHEHKLVKCTHKGEYTGATMHDCVCVDTGESIQRCTHTCVNTHVLAHSSHTCTHTASLPCGLWQSP